MNYTNEIITKIKRNRISSTEVADCLDKTGDVKGVFALNKGHFRVGRVFWVYAWNQSNWEVHEQIRDIQENDIVFIEPFNCGDRAIIGDLVTKFILLYKQASALVTVGKLRDVPHLIKENWPIWYMGSTPIGCFNRPNYDNPMDDNIIKTRMNEFNGSIAVCDDSGVVIIPKDFHNEEFLKKLDWIEEQEDIWFDCIDRLKWDTYDTVCLKKYLDKNAE
jgi:regulator of RNase E activity RraA